MRAEDMPARKPWGPSRSQCRIEPRTFSSRLKGKVYKSTHLTLLIVEHTRFSLARKPKSQERLQFHKLLESSAITTGQSKVGKHTDID